MLVIDEIVASIFATLETHGETSREERVKAIADQIRGKLQDAGDAERSNALDEIEKRFPCQGTDQDHALVEMREELARVTAERDQLAAQLRDLGGEALTAFLEEEVTKAGAARPQAPPTFDSGHAVRAYLSTCFKILEVLTSHVNDSLTFVDSAYKIDDLRSVVGHAMEQDDPQILERELKKVRRCLRQLISQPFVFLQNWCNDAQGQFQASVFLERGKQKAAKAFEEYEDFIHRYQFAQSVFPPLKTTLRNRLQEVLKGLSGTPSMGDGEVTAPM